MVEDCLMFPEEADKIRAIASALRTAPCYVADCFGLSPVLVEQLLHARGQYSDSSGSSLLYAVRLHYGDSAATLILNYLEGV